ncbi:MAG: 2-succinyl-5-enolpyruvyl-6-hydroxy-3-cyclohexene-carboxylic-acid synthase [Actinomycetia bacterium]|nr:2-succinyl-5-enolpyruvyl-6-hydroxy-3-cyclohexene-carboxylic-acid synthase [Actinomycetes bacterium]
MHSRDANTAFANALVDEWARGGVSHAVIAPGSRSTPLALALVRDDRITPHVVLDERSAAFFALGLAKASGVPAVLLCTSGTAAANFHPAVVEAHHARVPMLLCSADRPPELRDVGAPQTIDQAHLYGLILRWSHDPGPPDDTVGAGARWRALACRSLAKAMASPPGPVHLNLPFREPLVPTGEPLVDAPGRQDGRPWTGTLPRAATASAEAVTVLASLVREARTGVIVAGFGARVDGGALDRFSAATGWPVLADAVSNARRWPSVVSTYEALLRSPGFASANVPDLAVRIGAPLTSKVANQWLDAIPTVLVDEYDGWLDPPRAAVQRIVASPTSLLDATATTLAADGASGRARDEWQAADAIARRAIDALLDADDSPCEARVARDVAACAPEGAQLVVASSLAVRALEWCMAPRDDITLYANRGANGIDGFVSTALGVATATRAPTIALLGDLCFLHDSNGLLGAAARGVDATFVVVDNDGGGIFSYLPQQDLAEFETLFATPQRVDLVAVARAHGVDAERVTRAPELPGAVKESVGRGGVRVLVVPVDRPSSVARHQSLWRAVDAALAS